MFARRSRMDIIYSILKVIGEHNPGALPTHILYKSNLSHVLFKSYLEILLKNGLIRARKIGKKLVYNITDKGEQFIRTYESMRSTLAKK